MSEGELKKRLIEIYEYEKGASAIVEILDEAKKDFFKKVSFVDENHIKEWVTYHKEIGDTEDDFLKALEWFLKWFGEQK